LLDRPTDSRALRSRGVREDSSIFLGVVCIALQVLEVDVWESDGGYVWKQIITSFGTVHGACQPLLLLSLSFFSNRISFLLASLLWVLLFYGLCIGSQMARQENYLQFRP
jgi:hypothetical protein